MSAPGCGRDRQVQAPSRRHVLAVGAAALALASVPGIARAATAGARTTEPQSRPREGRALASLNGTWDFMPTTGTPTAPPVTGTWSSIPVPAEWNMTAGNFATAWGAYDLFETPSDWNSVDVAWYRRTVDVPAAQRGQRIVLRFEAVNFEATVFFNGTQVTRHSGGLLPFEADVTDQVSWGGTNTVHVLVRSGNVAARQSDGWHYPNGSWWGQTCWGIWQDVWLLARPAVYVQDSYVVTSVTGKRITVTTTLANVGAAAATANIKHQVLDGGKTVLTSGGGNEVTVPAGGTATVTFGQPWAEPRLWSPADPHLYDLAVTATSAPGQPADTFSVRFGFREVAVQGTDILLNGEPVMLRGDAWHYMGSVENSRAYATAWFSMVKALGVNYLRLHAMPYPPVFYDVADEMGLLIVAESGIYGSSGNYALSAADFWDNCVTHLTDRVLRDRNHPSVFAWSAENEMLAAFGQSWSAKVAALKPVVTALDATRPVYFEGDGDPQDAGDLESTHYPWEITTSNTAIPESAYALAPGGPNAGFWDREKPMLIGEFSSMYYATPSQVSAIGGPATYADLDGLWSAHALIVGAQIEGFRYAGTTGVSPWNTVWYGMRHLPFDPARESLPLPGDTGPKLLQVGRYATTLNPGFENDLPRWQPNPIHDAMARVMPAIAALATDYRTHFWGGSTLSRTYAVYDEVGTQRTVTVSWELKLTGAGTTRGSQRAAVPPDGKTDVTFGIAVPKVKRITAGTLTVRVAAGGPALYQHDAPVTVYPASAGQRTTEAPLAAAVIEAAGSTATSDALAALGVTTRTITDLSALPTGQEVLVFGEGATVNATPDQTAALTAFIQGGGRVLSFAQQTLPQLLPWPVLLAGSPQTITHVAAPHHPVLAGIGPDDLRWWNTTSEQVVSKTIVKPRYGAFTSLADAGPGLASSALAEAPYGSGAALFCQFPVISAVGDEPIAAVLLRNLVDYLATRPSAPRRRLGVVSPADSALTGTLTASSVSFTAVTTVSADALAALDVLLVDASAGNTVGLAAVQAGASAVSSWVSGGGTLWVNGLTTATLGSLSGVLPDGVTLTALDAAHQLGAVTTGDSAVLDGLNNADLDWPGASTPLVTAAVSGSGGTSAADSRGVDWTAFAAGAEQNKYQVAEESALGFTPGSVFWISGSGSGQVVIDMLSWPASIALPTQTALAAGIAAGLGVAFTAGSGSGLLPTTGWTGFANPNNAAAGNAFDRIESTRWSSDALQTPGMYYGVDLGATHTLTRIVWDDSPAPGDLPRGVDIEISADGTTYTTALSLTAAQVSSMTNAGVLTIPLNSVTTRYLKMVDTGSAPGNYVSMYELYLFGQ
jgi:glycosyl hydrolase family 2/F5/8 type C domain-containing protein